MTTTPSSPQLPATPPPTTWWIIWSSIGFGLVVIYLVMPSLDMAPPSELLRYIPLIPLAGSAVMRWLVLPRFDAQSGAKAFPMFIAGLALAESSGILGLILAPTLREAYFVLALLGIAQFAPTFAGNYQR